jgi:putative ATPase
MADLFETSRQQRREKVLPLAARLRPSTLADFIGQGHLLGTGAPLRLLIENDSLGSAILFGPPGCGKTSIARLIQACTRRKFVSINAVSAGVPQVREIIAGARALLEQTGCGTILFIDEIHRFNRAQQDILLPDVESGVISILGVTTQNPFFAINAPLISRCRLFQFNALTQEEIAAVIRQAIHRCNAGGPETADGIQLTDEALQFLASQSDGDARRALSTLETAIELAVLREKTSCSLTVDDIREARQVRPIHFDPTGDEHYDLTSALIKSIRGSDPDAAIYWLAKLLVASSDVRFIARRIAIAASEDIGNAQPAALAMVAAMVQLVEFLGMPEARIPLAQTVIYLACSEKSNSAISAIDSAMEAVRNGPAIAVPPHLRDAHYAGAAQLGHTGYRYPHDNPGGWVEQVYLPGDYHFYFPTGRGVEARFAEFLARRDDKTKPANRTDGAS